MFTNFKLCDAGIRQFGLFRIEMVLTNWILKELLMKFPLHTILTWLILITSLDKLWLSFRLTLFMFQKLSSIKFPAKNLHLITVTIPWSCFSLLVEKSSIEMTISVRAGGRSGASSRSLACAKKCWEKDSDENTGNLERENHNQSLFQVKMETGISGLFENIKGWNCNFWDQSGFLIFFAKR